MSHPPAELPRDGEATTTETDPYFVLDFCEEAIIDERDVRISTLTAGVDRGQERYGVLRGYAGEASGLLRQALTVLAQDVPR